MIKESSSIPDAPQPTDDLLSKDHLIASKDYKGAMNQAVLPYLQNRESVVTMPGADSRPLRVVSYVADDPQGTVVIVHGFTENALKYSEIIYSLLRHHYAVLAYDQRGHGLSWRDPVIKDSSVTHVDCFEDYVTDLKAVCDTVLPDMPRPYLLFAHSMGGAVSSLFLERYPQVISAAVLCAPMIAPHTGGVPSGIARSLCRIAIMFGKSKQNPFFMHPWSGPEDFETSCATDRARFDWYDEIKTSTPAYRNAVPTWRWTYESLGVTAKILKAGAPESIVCPVLLFSAEHDFSVLPQPQKDFIARIHDGQLIHVKDARHEIYRSTNAVLFPWWHSILEFYQQKGGSRA